MTRHRRRRQSGQILVLATISLVVLMGFLALSVDVGLLWARRRQMQAAADAAAVAAAIALKSGGSSQTAAKNISSLNGFTDGTNGATVTVNNPPLSGTYAGNNGYIEVIVDQPEPVYFLGVLGYKTIDVSARAVSSQISGPACIYALDSSASSAISVSGTASLSLPNCGIIDNSSSSSALSTNGGGTITASSIGVAGGTSGSGFSPTPITGIAPVPDPLAGLAAPTGGACDYTNYSLGTGQNKQAATLSPGVYCGGITIGAQGVATLTAGTYILDGGGLTVQAGAVMSGTGVMFYNTYDKTHSFGPIKISGSATVNLSAPTSGTYVGILFFQDRTEISSKQNDTSIITGNAQSTFDGTIYIPGTPLQYAGTSSSNGYTIVIADQISLVGNTTLGSNYSSLAGDKSPIQSTGLYE